MRHQPEYQILLVEDDPDHKEMIQRAFETDSRCQLVNSTTLRGARRAIEFTPPDLIITEFKLPDGKGTDLLQPISSCPAIVMSSASDEKIAVKAMRSGAAEYIVKTQENLATLPRTANRVMREWRLLLDQRLAHEHQDRLIAILDATPDLICIANLDGFVTYLNQAGRRMLGLEREEDIGTIRLADFHVPADARTLLNEGIPDAMRDGSWSGETTLLARSGEKILTSQVLLSHCNARGDVEFLSTIARDIRNIRAAEERVEYLAYYDTLTGLPNRNELSKRLEIEVARVRRTGKQGALMFIDLDNFKYINDSMGHPAGDSVLQEMAQRLQSSLRRDDTVARLGGDEFIVILSGLNTNLMKAVAQAREIAGKIRERISMECRVGDSELQMSASIGISMISADYASGHDLLRFADTAMYQAKREGRNRMVFFNESMSSDVTRHLELENQLRRALREGQFRLYFQPLVNGARHLVGAETLIRWDHPEQGILAPSEFLDVLESSGLIIDVGSWVIKAALTQMTHWIGQGLWHPEFMICINVSPRQFLDNQFTEDLYAQLERINAPPGSIVIEVTEHNIIHNLDGAIARMDEMKKHGIQFSLDDFGTGYSSLSHLKNLPVSHVKIDRAFVHDICSNTGDQAMVRSILAMSQHLGLSVVAEGVETSGHFELLKEFDCEYYQGYYFSKPMSTEDMEAYLLVHKPAA